MVAANMDFDSFFRNKIERMLIVASWVEAVRKKLGLESVSQVWGDKPEWYFWIQQTPGVYALVFEEGETGQIADRTLFLGRFAVKCYPYVAAPMFDTFSPREQEMVTSEVFDHTQTPRLEAREEIPEAYFKVGSISFMLDAAEDFAMFTFDSLDFLRWSVQCAKTGNENIPNKVQEKSIVRNIPGVQIAYPLFDRLVGLYAFYSKLSPAFIGTTRSAGSEWIVDINQTPQRRACNETRQWSASVLFLDKADGTVPVDAIWRSHMEPEEQIVFEHAFSHSACSHFREAGIPHMVINSLWWNLARADFKSELASICGCENHEHPAFETQ